MKSILSICLATTLILAACELQPNNKAQKQSSTKTEISEDSLRASYFKEQGVEYSNLANIGYWVFNMPKDPNISGSTPIKYTAFLYKDMSTTKYYLLERDYVEKSLVVRPLFLKKKDTRYVMIFKETPWLKYEFDTEGNCWETETGLSPLQGTGEINTEAID